MPHSDAGWIRRRFIVLFHVYLGGMTRTAMLQERKRTCDACKTFAVLVPGPLKYNEIYAITTYSNTVNT